MEVFWKAERSNHCWTLGWGPEDGCMLCWPRGLWVPPRVGYAADGRWWRGPMSIPIFLQGWGSWHPPDSWPWGALVAHLTRLCVSCPGSRVNSYSISLPELPDFRRIFFSLMVSFFFFLTHHLQNMWFSCCWEKYLCEATPNFSECVFHVFHINVYTSVTICG